METTCAQLAFRRRLQPRARNAEGGGCARPRACPAAAATPPACTRPASYQTWSSPRDGLDDDTGAARQHDIWTSVLLAAAALASWTRCYPATVDEPARPSNCDLVRDLITTLLTLVPLCLIADAVCRIKSARVPPVMGKSRAWVNGAAVAAGAPTIQLALSPTETIVELANNITVLCNGSLHGPKLYVSTDSLGERSSLQPLQPCLQYTTCITSLLFCKIIFPSKPFFLALDS